jgi:hypothetical protein
MQDNALANANRGQRNNSSAAKTGSADGHAQVQLNSKMCLCSTSIMGRGKRVIFVFVVV